MTDDFTNLERGASCYAISNSTTIYSYKTNVRSTYTQIGGKWYKTSSQNYNNLPTGSNCFTYSEITKLNTNAAYYPIYVMIGLLLAVFVWFVVFKLLGRLVKWRN